MEPDTLTAVDRRGAPKGTAVRRKLIVPKWFGIAPFALFVAIFLVVPILVNIWTAFRQDGGFSLEHMHSLLEAQYLSAFGNTIKLSAFTAVISGVFGFLLAWALVTAKRPKWLREVVYSFSIVAARSGGVPLAFAFLATLGTQGLVTGALRDTTGWNIASFIDLASFWGLLLVYLYFQIPLMAVLVLPALYGLKSEWRDASTSLGSTRMQYMRHIAFPILWPGILGAVIVVFADSFQAYATAYALAGGGANLVPILIGFFISGNVYTDEGLAASLVTGMIIVISLAMLLRFWLLRRASKWLR